jgi:transcriptional regulator of heat shock response
MTIDRETRRNRVLEAIVKAHIGSALPVGSKYIAEMLDLSSATIRNVMFELEEQGYVKQPYTSAGRIPTDLGYRRYVDNMMRVRRTSEEDIFSRIAHYIAKKRFFEEIIEGISSAISKITNYTGIALSPNNKVYFDGTYHMLEHPEFNKLYMARDFLRVMEERDELLRIMSRDLETKGTTIHIGRENTFEELQECTIITSTYRVKNHISGNIGVIGPMRMRYEEVVPLVERLAEITTETLEEISE